MQTVDSEMEIRDHTETCSMNAAFCLFFMNLPDLFLKIPVPVFRNLPVVFGLQCLRKSNSLLIAHHCDSFLFGQHNASLLFAVMSFL